MDWTTGSAYSKLSSLLFEYRYHSLNIQYMCYFNYEFTYEQYQKNTMVEIVSIVLQN